VLILRELERKLGLAAVLSRHIPDDRDLTRITLAQLQRHDAGADVRDCQRPRGLRRP
jgi:hypothetical protein